MFASFDGRQRVEIAQLVFMTESFSSYLRRTRNEKNLTQQELADRSNGAFKQSYVSALERGVVSDPGVFYLDAIALALGVPKEEVYDAAGRKVKLEAIQEDKAIYTTDIPDDVLRYIKDPDVQELVRYYNGTPPEIRPFSKNAVKRFRDASDIADEIEAARTAGKRADRNENPSE